MTSTEPAHGQWCHCGGWWLHDEPIFDAGQLHDVHVCGGAS